MAQTDSFRHASGIEIPRGARRSLRVPAGALAIGMAVTDILVISNSAMLIDSIYHRYFLQAEKGLTEPFALGLTVASIFAGWVYVKGGYTLQTFSNGRAQLVLAAHGWIVSFFVVAWIGFLSKSTAEYSRLSWSLVFILGFVSLSMFRLAGTALLTHAVRKSRLSLERAYLIIAAPIEHVDQICTQLQSIGINVAGLDVITGSPRKFAEFAARLEVATERSQQALAVDAYDSLYVYSSWKGRRWLDLLRSVMSRLPLPVYLIADRIDDPVLSLGPIGIANLYGIEIQRPPLNWNERLIKRALDLALATGAIILLAPLLLLVALAIRFGTGSPVFFRQERKGFGGKCFNIIKFRTMRVHEDPEVKQVRRNDPRVTRLGKVLRKTSIDELPQLLNVIVGDMSLVGPRPHATKHDNTYDQLISSYAHRQRVKPGITGWAQIHGLRGETSELDQMVERVRYDLWYIANWSFWLDLRIIARTAVAVLFDRKAY